MAGTVVKIKQSAVAGRLPTHSAGSTYIEQGELALNTADKKLYSKDGSGTIFEIGGSAEAGANEIITTDFTATSNQTSFTVSYSYSNDHVNVYYNGVHLSTTDFTATNGTSVVLGTGAATGDLITIEVIKALSLASGSDIDEHEFTATASQTSFTISGGYNATSSDVEVYVNGIKLRAADFTATSGTAVVLGTGATVNDEVTIRIIKVAVLASVVNASATTGSAIIPAGTTAQRDASPSAGYLRWNSTLTQLEVYNGSAWTDAQQLTAAEVKTAYESNSDTNEFSDAEQSKLSLIEASADVTDTTNVTSAGALMDSEVTNLADVKAFDTSDYATAAQGTLATAALPKSGGTMTGDIVLGTNTVGGVEIRTNGAQTTNIGLGASAITAQTTGGRNTALGYEALKANDTGWYNTAIGTYTLTGDHNFYANTAVGAYSMEVNTEGNYNTAMGLQSLADNTTGDSNVAIGRLAVAYNTTGTENTSIGTKSLKSNTTGSYNTASGYRSLYANTTASHNTAMGYYALDANTTGSKNIAIGYGAGDAITTGSNNVIIGDYAGTTTLADTVAIYSGTTERLKVTSSGLTINGSAIVSYDSTVADAALPKSGGTMTGSILLGNYNVTHTDNGAAYFGNSNDLQIYHDGGNSYIKNTTGWLNVPLSQNGMSIANSNFTEILAKFKLNDAVELYYNGSEKLATTNTGIDVTGNVVVSGTVDGRDIATDGTKLDGIEASADVTDTTNVVAALTAGTGITIASNGTLAVGPVALTTVQIAASQVAQLALTAQEGDVVVRSDEKKSYMHNGGSAGTMADYTELQTPTDSVLSINGQTGAITAAQIKTAYESNSDTNEFSDAEQTKLSNIETSADVTDATNVASAGAVMESDATTAAMSFVVDEDNMASNSATKLSTQQAIKAYVDNQINLVPDAVAMAIALG